MLKRCVAFAWALLAWPPLAWPLLACSAPLILNGLACSDGNANASADANAALAISPQRGTLLVGYYTKDSFDDLDQVPDCPVLWGLQGGNWTMPTLRTQNFDDAVTATGTLLLGDEMIGTTQAQAHLQDRMDGWHELTYLPIPVTHATPNEATPIDDIYGRAATLSFLLKGSSGAQLKATYTVTLLRSEVTE